MIATEAGLLTERQVNALFTPCRKVDEWGPGNYRKVVQFGQVRVLTFLTFDWFAESKPCWHAAVAIMDTAQSLKPVILWDHNDQAAAVAIASELINGCGDPAKGRWARKTPNGLDLYRAPKPAETTLALKVINTMAPLPSFFKLNGLPDEVEELFNAGRDVGKRSIHATNGRAEGAAAPDGSAAASTRQKTILERLGE